MITSQSIEGLKNIINIVDVIGSNIEIKKTGANFKACCPFHGEKTASFVISPAKQIYHCFGCGVGGDAIKFIQEYKKLSFYESIEDISSYYNYQLEYDKNNEVKNYKDIIEFLNNIYKNALADKQTEWLKNRGITDESIQKWEIGWASKTDEQIKALTTNFYSLSDAEDIGVIAKENDRKYSYFTNRIMFPIRNHSGKLIGFGGRIIEGDRAKYLNSPATKLFDKSRNFYGLNFAKEHIFKKGVMVITEGYIDVIMMHQIGIKTAVATLGTALTEHHALEIKKMGVRVLLCYDGDKAGYEAAHKASLLLSEKNIDGSVVFFADGYDPAQMVAEKKEDELIALMKRPTKMIPFAIENIVANYDLTNPHEKNKALKSVVTYLNTLEPIIADEYKRYTSKKLGIDSKHITTKDINNGSSDTQLLSIGTDEKILKTLCEEPRLVDNFLDIVEYEALQNDKRFLSVIEGRLNDAELTPIQVLDIATYQVDDFVKASKLKQCRYLCEQKIKLVQDDNPNAIPILQKINLKIINLMM